MNNKLSSEDIQINTMYSTRYYTSLVKKIANYDGDSKKERRGKEKLCKTCFYLRDGIAGQGFTKYTCRNCGKEDMHPNTNTPKYCKECADKFNICVKCGAER